MAFIHLPIHFIQFTFFMKTKHKQTKAFISLGWVCILSVLLLRFIALNSLILLQKLLSIIFAMRRPIIIFYYG